jgi:hypothetical protein
LSVCLGELAARLEKKEEEGSEQEKEHKKKTLSNDNKDGKLEEGKEEQENARGSN